MAGISCTGEAAYSIRMSDSVCRTIEGESDNSLASRIRIVLVETSHPGNIGAVARAMKNMSLSRLYLVSPKQFPDPDATVRAAGAIEILDKAVCCESLSAALEGAEVVYGASARTRSLPWPIIAPREVAEQCVDLHAGREIALVFGRERSGLTNEELGRCNYLLHIPTNPDFSSLNLGAAVQVVSYELMVASQRAGDGDKGQPSGEPLAASDDLERMYQHMEQALTHVGFLNENNPRQMMHRLRRLFNRVELEQVELNIIRGILTAIEGKKRKPQQ